MYPTHQIHHHAKTCSCRNCLKGDKEEDILLNGSRIDKLYYEKYLPLRERKLIDKLVKTRGLYDDIRDKILSGSNIDQYQEGDRNKRRDLQSDDETETKQIHKLVNLVDTGQLHSLNSSVALHSVCCSCCTCSSKRHEHSNQKQKANIHGVKRVVRYRAVKSDPCTCCLKFSDTVHQEPIKDQPKENTFFDKKNETKGQQLKKESKVVRLKNCECIVYNNKPRTNSIEKISNATKKLRNSIRSSVSDFKNVFRIKKDSIVLFREKLKKKQTVKKWTCDPGYCIPEKCVPEECLINIKSRGNRNKRDKRRISNFMEPLQLQSKISYAIPSLKSVSAKHELNRCFCTLQLEKPNNAAPEPVIHKVAKKPTFSTKTKTKAKQTNLRCDCKIPNSLSACECKIPDTLSTHTKKLNISIQASEKKFKNTPLLPYECEPLFCNPGVCNPLICKEKIKLRNRKLSNISSLSRHTNTYIVPKKIKMTSASVTKYPPQTYLNRIPKRNRSLKSEKLNAPYAPKSKSSPDAPTRQAVKLSSNFRFDIEFFKDRNFPDQKKNVTNHDIEHRIEKVTKPTNDVEIKNRQYDVEHKIAHKRNKNRVMTREPFLNRCFCTLKLNKRAKQYTKTESFSKMTQVNNDENRHVIPIKYSSSMTATVPDHRIPSQVFRNDLLPYECEPYFCNPGQCDPYTCAKRIKMRNQTVKRISRNNMTMDLPRKSVSSFTSTVTSKSAATYPARQNHGRHIKKFASSSPISNEPTSYESPSSSPQRQAVRIGSNFQFNIEFYKDKGNIDSVNRGTNESSEITRDTKNLRHLEKRKKIKTRGIHTKTPHLNHRISQISSQVKSTLTATEPFLKRCFCTLKLNKLPYATKKDFDTKMMPTYRHNRIESKMKYTQTTRPFDSPLVYVTPPISEPTDLLPYECEPHFCVPGHCNPIICDERIKERNKQSGGLLKRCFCTLKFHSPMNKDRFETTAPIYTKTKGTETLQKRHLKKHLNLLPYECEPGVCVPGYCDPYECQKAIERRIKDIAYNTKQVNTNRTKLRTALNGHSKSLWNNQESQSVFKQPTQNKYEKFKRRKRKNRDHGLILPNSNNVRQSVKLCSQVGFNIEFSKNRLSPGVKSRKAR